MNLSIRKRFSFGPLTCLLFSSVVTGCGLAESVDGPIRSGEVQLETSACKQMLQHTDLIVGGVMAQSAAPPGTTPPLTCQPVSMTQCTVCYQTETTTETLSLQSKDCAIDPPAQGQQYDLKMSVHDLSLTATQQPPNQVALGGSGLIDVSANLPVLGTVSGTAGYQIKSGVLDNSAGTLTLDLLMTYQLGSGVPVNVEVQATGTRENIAGTVTGQDLSCIVSGSLAAPTINCQ